MILVRMQESRFRARLKKLEGKIPPACMQGSSSEYFARNSHFRRKFQNIIAQFIKFADTCRAEIFTAGYFFHSFHFIPVFVIYSLSCLPVRQTFPTVGLNIPSVK